MGQNTTTICLHLSLAILCSILLYPMWVLNQWAQHCLKNNVQWLLRVFMTVLSHAENESFSNIIRTHSKENIGVYWIIPCICMTAKNKTDYDFSLYQFLWQTSLKFARLISLLVPLWSEVTVILEPGPVVHVHVQGMHWNFWFCRFAKSLVHFL